MHSEGVAFFGGMGRAAPGILDELQVAPWGITDKLWLTRASSHITLRVRRASRYLQSYQRDTGHRPYSLLERRLGTGPAQMHGDAQQW